MFWQRFLIRAVYGTAVILSVILLILLGLLVESKLHIFQLASEKVLTPTEPPTPFPVGVNMHTKVITENPQVFGYYSDTLVVAPEHRDHWWNKLAAVFSKDHWYQNLASPVSRILVIWPGERKEEISKNIGDILGWSESDQVEFQTLMDSAYPILTEGKYYPGQYVTHSEATPQEMKLEIERSFNNAVLDRYTPEVATRVPLEDALIIASLIEREASDFTNMREVSGVIWNRLFTNMPLQLDATLQYVRGSKTTEQSWWPKVRPSDKFIDSAYNTYQNTGLPPAPIANPSAEAILAALNPVVTDCLFYFHAKGGRYYCSPTYEEHVAKLKSLYGRGS